MKINANIYNSIITEPFDVQELENGVKVELHSLNQNETLFNQYAPKAKFAIWTCADSKNYRLLLEDKYYEHVRELYGRRVNQCMINFWDDVEKERGKVVKFFFIPVIAVVIILSVVLMALSFTNVLDETGQWISMGALLVGFVICNTIINRKIDSIVSKHNDTAVSKIKNFIGHKRFEELQHAQQTHYDEFFNIPEDERVGNLPEEEQPVEEENKPE